jgi:hypothetical protein
VKRSVAIAWLASLGGASAGCNALLDNAEHEMAGDASFGTSVDAGHRDGSLEADDAGLDEANAPAGDDDGAIADGASSVDGTILGDSGADALPPVDAAVDASGVDGAAADAAPTGVPCSTRNPAPLFCDDFDQGTSNNLWGSIHTNEGSVVVNGADSVSSPHSMLVTVNADADPNVLDVAGIKTLPTNSTSGKCTLAFDLKIDAGATTSGAVAVLGAIELNGASAVWDLELEVSYQSAASAFGLVLLEITPQVSHAATQTIPMGTWARVEMSIVLPPAADGSASASLVLNGKTVVNTTVHVLASALPSGPLAAYVGTNFATRASGGWSIRYDDVTFDLR